MILIITHHWTWVRVRVCWRVVGVLSHSGPH